MQICPKIGISLFCTKLLIISRIIHIPSYESTDLLNGFVQITFIGKVYNFASMAALCFLNGFIYVYMIE